jgi:hypothetical protein
MPQELDALRRCALEEGKRKLEELKERVRKNYKRLVFELHPDRTGNDPVKTERFVLFGRIKDEFEKLQLQPRPVTQIRPPPNVTVVRVVTWTRASHAYNTSNTSTTTESVGVPFRVSTMRPT